MGSEQINPIGPHEPELPLLLGTKSFEEPLYKSLFRELDEFFFPKKLPPLQVESKPEPVKDIWGFYNEKKDGGLGSTGVHILIAAIIVGGTLWAHRVVTAAPAPKPTVMLVDPNDIPPMKAGRTISGGGGGGGDRDVLKASAGRLPKRSLDQITPPTVVLRNEHPKLAVEQTVIIPPEVKLASNNMPNIGDPMSHLTMPSNGTGR